MSDGLFNKFTSFLTGSEDYEDTYYDYQEPYDPYIPQQERETVLAQEPDFSKPKPSPRQDKVVSLGKQDKQEVVIVNPEDMSSSELIANHLMENRTVICNLENIDGYTGQRILDFISGSVYALGGSVTAASEKIFVVMPRTVSLVSEHDTHDEPQYDENSYESNERYAM